jgi:glycosyltransferase involved in cell wall biosynthesis
MRRIPLLYALHSGNLYGTERMALATAAGLADQFDPMILAPQGPVLAEAQRMGMKAQAFSSTREFAQLIRPLFASSTDIAFIATGVVHSFCAFAVNAVYRRRLSHLHVVHGGTDERFSYGRKRLLNHSSAVLVAVSQFVRERLIANGARSRNIHVIENFLPTARTSGCLHRLPFTGSPISRAVVISRIDPIKRVDLLLDVLDQEPALNSLQVRVLGTGWDLETLRARAKQTHPNVTFVGFVNDIESELASSDLLIHLCPAEPFGLAIIEAMAADVPVLVPDRGGAGSLVEKTTGYRFHADDSASLAESLLHVMRATPAELNGIVAQARGLLHSRFSPDARINDYRKLLEEGLA